MWDGLRRWWQDLSESLERLARAPVPVPVRVGPRTR